MNVSVEKFVEKAKKFVSDEIVPQIADKNRRWGIGAVLSAITPDSLPALIEVFPQAAMIAPLAKASGVFKDGEVNVDKLESILEGGFAVSDNEMTLSMLLPKILDPEQKQICIKLTPRVWESFRRSLE